MSIDITKAVDGSFYKFDCSIQLNNDLTRDAHAKFIAPCSVDGQYVVLDGIVYVDASIDTDMSYLCHKCLAPATMHLSRNMSASYYRQDLQRASTKVSSAKESTKESAKDASKEGIEDLPGDYPYSGFSIDISEAVYQEIMLSMPTRLLCKKDCRGLCLICGVNLNTNSCGCNEDSRDQQLEQARNPFAQLKNLNFKSGGASNGGTKA